MFEKKTIRIKDMLIFALQKWRLIVIGALVCAILLPSVIYIKGSKTTGGPVKEDTEAEKELPVGVLEERIIALADLYKQVNSMEEQIVRISPLVNENGEMRYAAIQYYIAISEEYASNLGSIAPLYSGLLNSEGFTDPLLECMDNKLDASYMRQYSSATVTGYNMVLKVPCGNGNDETSFLSRMKTLIDDKTKEYQDNFKYELQTVNEGCLYENNATYSAERKAIDDRVNSLNAQINSFTSGLEDEQIELGKKLASGEMTVEAVRESLEKSGDEANSPTVAFSFGVKKTIIYALIGAILGMLLMTYICCIIYGLSGKLHTARDLSEQAGIMLLGTVILPPGDRFMKEIDNLIFRTINKGAKNKDKEQQIREIAPAFSIVAKQNRIENICFTSSVFGRIEAGIQKGFEEAVCAEGFGAKFVDDIVTDRESLYKCSQSDGIVLVEQIGCSDLSDIEDEIITAKGFGIRILGAVIME